MERERIQQGRRQLLRASVGMAITPFAFGYAEAKSAAAPALSGFEMPLESAPHERTFMQWPTSLDVYDRASLVDVQLSIARIANTISRYEPVVMLVGRDKAAAARRTLSGDVALWDIPADDLWCRDSGPTFVRNAKGELAVAHIRFNGWGNKQTHRNDAMIAPHIAKRLGLSLLDTGLVGEQGGVEHDGAGTLLAHASCWANPNRNRQSEAEVGKRLLGALGGKKMIWAPGVKGKDITDDHIDALARFIAPGKVLIQLDDQIDYSDPFSVSGHETLRILEQATDARGKRLEIIRLPNPVDIRSKNDDFVASYVNYYVCNGAVIAAQFGDRRADAQARALLQSLYPTRKVEMIDIDPIGESGGGIHCATQQQPQTGHA
ncbi:agmatine/peptidylarginine deiminase [Sphingomonas sp. SUN039]|uniref:agmatine deiminase family protein n=1 Tax=Sphingomonas sp. SUN039 TaxID=2937787 RepID=UPI0021646209|nr:agmatine deiminase family protein [Sphingomonas sp. SUN039]UVO54230.1 agmatine deiminase family protein [Sphingomonas sp. SUN039]